jgi:hypothetical protein
MFWGHVSFVQMGFNRVADKASSSIPIYFKTRKSICTQKNGFIKSLIKIWGLNERSLVKSGGQGFVFLRKGSIIPDILDPVLQPDPTFLFLYTLLILSINNV